MWISILFGIFIQVFFPEFSMEIVQAIVIKHHKTYYILELYIICIYIYIYLLMQSACKKAIIDGQIIT